MDDSKKKRLALGAVGSIFSVIVVPELLDNLQVPLSITLSGSALCVVGFLTWAFRPQRIYAIAAVTTALVVLATTVISEVRKPPPERKAIQSRPVISDVEFGLLPEAVNGEDLDAHFVFRNTSPHRVTISQISYHIPTVLSDGQIGKLQIPEEGRRNWTINGKKLLTAKRVYLTFAYEFEKFNSKTNGAVTFDIPANVNAGQEIPPSECCEAPKIDFEVERHKQINFELRNRPNGEINLKKIPDKDADGRPVKIFFGEGGQRQLVVDMKRREITFLIIQNDKQKIFVSKVGFTINDLHWIRFYWNDLEGVAGLNVDGVPARLLKD